MLAESWVFSCMLMVVYRSLFLLNFWVIVGLFSRLVQAGSLCLVEAINTRLQETHEICGYTVGNSQKNDTAQGSL